MRLLPLSSIVLLALVVPAPPARAQAPDTLRVVTRTMAAPPAAPPGVARVRQRIAQIRGQDAPSTPPGAATAAAAPAVDALDLLAMERRLMQGFDARLSMLYAAMGALAADGASARLPSLTQFYRLPPRPPEGTPAAEPVDPAPTRPAWRAPGEPAERPRATLPALLVERALLETGLFRTVDVVFAFDRAELLPHSRAVLDVVADVLRRHPHLDVEIAGHTDAVGAAAYNQALSQRRAEAVRAYLVAAGVAAERLVAAGYGEAYPVAGNDEPTGRTLNRRVEFVVLHGR